MLTNVKMMKRVVSGVVAAAMMVSMMPSAMAANYYTAPAKVSSTQVEAVKAPQVKSYANAGVQQLGADSTDMVWSRYANSNVVAKLRNPEANIVTLDRIEGLVCQYGAQTKHDFAEFLVDYCDQFMFVIVDSQKAVTGFQYALVETQNMMNMKNIQYDLELRNVDENSFTAEELQILKQYVKGDTFYAVQLIRRYRAPQYMNYNGQTVAMPQQSQVVVSNGTSKFTDTMNSITQVLSIPSLIKSAKNAFQNWNN